MTTYDLQQLNNKWVLFDADIIIKAYKYSKETEFVSFLHLLKNSGIIAVSTYHVFYEVISSSSSLQESTAQKDFFNDIIETPLPYDVSIMNTAINISNIYHNKNIRSCKASMSDCILSSYLKKYGENLTLITSNLSDFPLEIHDRIGIYTIDVGSQVITMGFIRFNQNKYKKCLLDFAKS